MNIRKFEIIPWLLISVLTGFVTYDTFTDYKKPLNGYPTVTGNVIQTGTCESKSTAMLRVPTKISSTVFCFDLGSAKAFQIFKTNRDYKDFKSNLLIGDEVKVYYSDQKSDERYTVIQILKKNKIIYSQKDYKKQERVGLGMLS